MRNFLRRIFPLIVVASFFSCKKEKIDSPKTTGPNIEIPLVDVRDSITGYYVGETSYTYNQVIKIVRYGDFVDSSSTDYSTIEDTIQISKTGSDSITIVSKMYTMSYLDTSKVTDTFNINCPYFTLLSGSAYGHSNIYVDRSNQNILHVHFYYTNGVIPTHLFERGYSKDYISSVRFLKKL